MQIESIETFIVDAYLIVRINTDNGIQGIGESTFWSFPHAVVSIVDTFAESLVGQDPLRIEHHWNSMYRQ